MSKKRLAVYGVLGIIVWAIFNAACLALMVPGYVDDAVQESAKGETGLQGATWISGASRRARTQG